MKKVLLLFSLLYSKKHCNGQAKYVENLEFSVGDASYASIGSGINFNVNLYYNEEQAPTLNSKNP